MEDFPILLALAPYQSSAIFLMFPRIFPGLRILDSRKHMVGTSLFCRTSFLTATSGDIISFRIFGKVIIVLNSTKVAKDLLEKNGNIYYDRPAIPIHEMWVVALLEQYIS